jgi:hypothetical protein
MQSVRGRRQNHSCRAKPAGQDDITPLCLERASMKTRAGSKDDTSGRATSSPPSPICWSRDRSSPCRGAPPPRARARGPKRRAADNAGHYRAERPEGAERTARVPGAHRATPTIPSLPPFSTARDGRDALGPTWTAGSTSQQPQAGAAPPTVKRPLGCGTCARRRHRTAHRPAHRLSRSRRGAGLARRVPPARPSLHATRAGPGPRRTQ